MKETKFKNRLKKELEFMFPGCVIFDIDPNWNRSHPDLVIVYGQRWAALDTKKQRNAPQQPNQGYYIDMLAAMSYAAFIDPNNKKEILNELEYALRP